MISLKLYTNEENQIHPLIQGFWKAHSHYDQSGEEAQEDLRANKNLGVYKGALYENVVGEALVKSGYELYYYKREDSTLEEDFFVRTASELIPVEVKAKSGKAKSMQAMIENER